MNFYRKTSLIILSVILLTGIRTQAQNGTVPIEKDNILKEFESRLSQQDSIDIREFFKPFVSDSIEIRTQEAKYKSIEDSSFRFKQFRIKEDLFNQLDSIQKAHNHPITDKKNQDESRLWIQILKIAGWIVALVVIFVVFFLIKTRKKDKKVITSIPAPEQGNTDIVVRRKTTSILRKQSLEDVIGNDNYMKIDCEDFCGNSAVRRMYIKNTCIKEIYNMYADNLRNPDKPNEYGCMVLGRWVFDKEADEYYVSLEQILLPGDDAIFAEYELNFGAKIQMKKKTDAE